MSWMEAAEAFRRSDTVIVPVGTLHAHGPTPIGIDARSVEVLADRLGRRTGLMVLPVQSYGENDKMKAYPGTITIRADVIEAVYVDICRSLHANGVRRVMFLNGHGGNHEPLLRAARAVRSLGVLAAIVEWGTIERALAPGQYADGNFTSHWGIAELAVAVAADGVEIADLRPGVYKGEWGTPPKVARPLGDEITPLGFSTFMFDGAEITIPADAWDIDVESPPEIPPGDLERLRGRGEEILERQTRFIAAFAKAFQRIDLARVLGPGAQAAAPSGRPAPG
jgi:creatinine amidohydrolase/Fe(II)-dependent formamide hydrolase-like protein